MLHVPSGWLRSARPWPGRRHQTDLPASNIEPSASPGQPDPRINLSVLSEGGAGAALPPPLPAAPPPPSTQRKPSNQFRAFVFPTTIHPRIRITLFPSNKKSLAPFVRLAPANAYQVE